MTQLAHRSVRVPFPAQISLAGETFQIHDFAVDFSVSGLFITTEQFVEPGTRGTVTFRISQWEDPFTIEGEVVRFVRPPDATAEQPAGLGIRFINLSELNRQRLQRLLAGAPGSVAEAIRRTAKDEHRALEEELRRRPTSQKLIFAVQAKGREIDAVIKDSNDSVVMRLLENPRIEQANICAILRNPRMKPRVLAAVEKDQRFAADQEVLTLLCIHPQAPIHQVRKLLPKLSRDRLQFIGRNMAVREPVRKEVARMLGETCAPPRV